MLRVNIFSNGTEFTSWQDDNCFKCKKYNDDVKKTCKLEYALGMALMGDGKVKEDIGKRIGRYPDRNWDCQERMPT